MTTYGRDYGVANREFRRAGDPRVGRQSQTWLKTPQGWRDAVLMEAEFGEPGKPTRFQKALGLGPDQSSAAIIREAGWKYVHFGGGVPPMLFDLKADPHETRNLAGDPAHTDQMARLAGRLLDRMMERRDRRLTGYSIGV